MAEPKLLFGIDMVSCDFCYRWEEDSSGNWNIYRGYGFAMSTFGRKKLVVPWVLDKAQVQVEHHRVCGATRYQLFEKVRPDHQGWACGACGKVFAFYTGYRESVYNERIRENARQRAVNCCAQTPQVKTTSDN